MTITELITLMSNKISSLNNARSTAVAVGDIEAVMRIDDEVQETQTSLDRLLTL